MISVFDSLCDIKRRVSDGEKPEIALRGLDDDTWSWLRYTATKEGFDSLRQVTDCCAGELLLLFLEKTENNYTDHVEARYNAGPVVIKESAKYHGY